MFISSDTDFGVLLAAGRATKPSVILTRAISEMPATDLAALLLANLSVLEADLAAGAIVAITKRGMRIRRLPIR